MSQTNSVVRFDTVTFAYDDGKNTLNEASFSARENTKYALMGQNGAGKSTLFKLIAGELAPTSGKIHLAHGATIAIAKQVMDREHHEKTVRTYLSSALTEVPRNIDKRITETLEVVNFAVPLEKTVGELSGGQQARLLLAHALIQEPDILLLDEPTNNLDAEGIGYLTAFILMYPKTVLVISHDADFLNSFTEGVFHLDVYTGKVDKYDGNYTDVVEEISARVERERAKNAQLLKTIQDRKDKVNFFSHKGGKMRKLASKLRDEIKEAEENMVGVRRDDKTIRDFIIPAEEWKEEVVTIDAVKVMLDHEPHQVNVEVRLRRKNHLLVKGPNGIGKSTLLRSLADGTNSDAKIAEGVKVGYYRQDFSGIDFSQTAYDSLASIMDVPDEEHIRHIASVFLLSRPELATTVGSLSEGQKGLLCFARFVLQEPGLIILDEPTNHINFRHIPIIAKAINAYEGSLIVVSHAEEFVSQLVFDQELDLSHLMKKIA